MNRLHFTFQDKDDSVTLDEKVREKILPSSPWLQARGTDYVLSRDFFSPARRVPDKQRYTLECPAGRWELRLMNRGLATEETFTPEFDRDVVLGQAHIVLLLESPHVDEYTSDLTPLGPARGTTGLGIHQCLASHVLPILIHADLQLQPERSYNFCLVNPIPYQASLGHTLEKFDPTLRDSIWLALWDACRVNFEQRLSDYRPEIIMNGCTSRTKPKVTQSVRDYLTKLKVAQSVRDYQPAQHFNVTHPSSWQRALAGFHKA